MSAVGIERMEVTFSIVDAENEGYGAAVPSVRVKSSRANR